jgi:DNA ligase-1
MASSSSSSLLKDIQDMVNDVNKINGTNEKIERLQKYPQLKSFLKLLMDPNQTTGVSSTKILEYEEKKSKSKSKPATKKSKTCADLPDLDLLTLIGKLYTREFSGNEAKEQVLHFMNTYPNYKTLICKIIDKNLETRLDIKQINKAFPNLIVEFSVALANDYSKCESYFKKNQSRPWLISRKYDGVRVIVEITPEGTQTYSRKGNILPALQPLARLLNPYGDISLEKKSDRQTFYLDGEICAIDGHGNENFAEAVSGARRKTVMMEKFRYYVFDMLTAEEFSSGESTCTLSERIVRAKSFIDKINRPQFIRLVDQHIYTPQTFQTLQTQSIEEGWEGLMLRMATTYKGKRSNDILKVKNFLVSEYKVKSIETGPMRIIDPNTGLETTIDTLKSVIIEHKGNDVGVGSGFTLEDRQEYYKNPDKIIGKIISVKYFEESSDKKGQISLRFPTFQGLYGEERDV